MRTIKFRGKASNDKWVYGSLTQGEAHNKKGEPFMVSHIAPSIPVASEDGFELLKMDRVYPETVGQFTGLHDKNGREIYEGDIIKFYDMDTYCINPDCEPHLLGYGSRLVKREEVVVFDDGVFGIDDEFHPIRNLMSCGFLDFDLKDLENYKNDPYFDDNGYDLDSIVGIEVIGNVFDNSDLIEKGGEQ